MKKIIPFPEDPTNGPNNLPRSVIKVLNDLGIHQDYADTFTQDQPFGAEIINIYQKKGIDTKS